MRALLSPCCVAPCATRRSARAPRAALPLAPPPPPAALRKCRLLRRRAVAARPRALAQPEQLVSVPPEDGGGATTVTLRITTGTRREDELSEPDAALMVALIAADGRAVLHREAGSSSGYPRGERGGSDTLRVRVPVNFGSPAAVWLAPERGAWRVDAAELSGGGDDAARPAWRRRYLAATACDAATELRPADDAAAFPRRSAEEVEAARLRGLEAYATLKARLLGVTALLAAPGTALAARLGGDGAAIAFAAGAAGGVLYLLSLQRGVDSLPGPSQPDAASSSASPPPPSSSPVGGAGGAARLAAVAVAAVLGARTLSEQGGAALPELRVELAAGAAGFLTYKLAVLLVGLVFPQGDDDAPRPPTAPPPL